MQHKLMRYLDDPIVGRLIAEHERTCLRLECLKKGLRSPQNIRGIIRQSGEEAYLRNRIRELIDAENTDQNRPMNRVLTVVAIIMILVGLANIFFGFWVGP